MQGEEDEGHTGQEEVVEGDVHGRLAAPVGGRDQTRDPQGGATLDLKKENNTGVLQGASDSSAGITQSQHAPDHLSVSSVVHRKIRRHSGRQHSQYDGLDVDQSVGDAIWDLLREVTV